MFGVCVHAFVRVYLYVNCGVAEKIFKGFVAEEDK